MTFALIVLDGWGYSKETRWNAIRKAKTPNFDSYLKKYPNTLLKASGKAVGLPKNYIGGSEVGHIHLGAGRLIPQTIVRIDSSIKDGSFFKNKNLKAAKKKKRIHLMGLLSDAGVHSHIRHLYALLDFFKGNEVFVHCFLDGRDMPPRSAGKYLKQLERRGAKIATISGRYYAMDRDKRWKRTKKAFDCIHNGKGLKASSVQSALENAYSRGENDEFVLPTLIEPNDIVKKNDAVVFFNFRSDRAKQITSLMLRKKIFLVSMIRYDSKFNNKFLFSSKKEKNILGEVISKNGLKQLRLAETEKYAHVTYFFNNQLNKPFKGEKRILIPSPKVSTYDKRPGMSARKIRDAFLKEMKKYDFIVVNFANPDMVGHTGDMKATVKACEVVDMCLGSIVKALVKSGGSGIIVGDHGNAEKMRYDDGVHYTAHTTNPVYCILIDEKKQNLKRGSLYDVAPTILQMMDIRKPKEMTGMTLLKRVKK